MMVGLQMGAPAGVQVHTSHNRGFTPEEVTARCVDRILSVSESAPPAIREQALAFRAQLERTVLFYMREAVNSDRITVENALREAGRPDLGEMIRRL
jgi:hypothetical protein